MKLGLALIASVTMVCASMAVAAQPELQGPASAPDPCRITPPPAIGKPDSRAPPSDNLSGRLTKCKGVLRPPRTNDGEAAINLLLPGPCLLSSHVNFHLPSPRTRWRRK